MSNASLTLKIPKGNASLSLKILSLLNFHLFVLSLSFSGIELLEAFHGIAGQLLVLCIFLPQSEPPFLGI